MAKLNFQPFLIIIYGDPVVHNNEISTTQPTETSHNKVSSTQRKQVATTKLVQRKQVATTKLAEHNVNKSQQQN